MWFDMYIIGKHKSKVLKWVKAKKIFTRRYVFVPIVYWYVARFLILHNHLFDWHDTEYSLPWLYVGDIGASLFCVILARQTTWVLQRGHACYCWIHLEQHSQRGCHLSSTGLIHLVHPSLSNPKKYEHDDISDNMFTYFPIACCPRVKISKQ